MKKSLLLLLVLFQFSNAGWFDRDEYLEPTANKNEIQKMFDRAQKEQKFVIVEAFSLTCPYCREMDENVFEDDEVRAILKKHYVFIKVDVTYGAQTLPRGLIKRFKGTTPSFFIFFPDGEYEETYSGSMTKDEFLEMLDIYKE
jgi:thioredoxin-related protein